MASNGARRRRAVHATAVALDGRALLILGPSRSGKSSLAAALLATATRPRPVELIGDDRVLLDMRGNGEIVVRPHPRIAGFIERRGLGIVAVPHRPSAPASGIVDLGDATTRQSLALDLPVLTVVGHAVDRRCDLVLHWWMEITHAALGSHLAEKSALTTLISGEHYSW